MNYTHMGWMWGASIERFIQRRAAREQRSEEDLNAEIARTIPLGVTPPEEECAKSVLFLVSDLARMVTGAQALMLIPLSLALEPVRYDSAAWMQFAWVSIAVAIVGDDLWNRMSRLLPLKMVGQMILFETLLALVSILFETLLALVYGFPWGWRLPQPLEIAACVLVAASVLSCIDAHCRHPPLATMAAQPVRTSRPA